MSLDAEAAERWYAELASDALSPEQEFERGWALTVLSRAMERLAKRAEARGKLREFEALRGSLLEGTLDRSYRELAEELGVTESTIKSSVHRLRKRFGECLREEIAETVDGPTEVEEELRHLLGALGP